MKKFRRRPWAYASAAVAAALLISPTAQAQLLGPSPSMEQQRVAGGNPLGFDPAPIFSELKLKPLGPMERHRRHYEGQAIMEDGGIVTVVFDPMGRIQEVERAEFEPSRTAAPIADPEPLFEKVRQAGFGNPVMSEMKRRHAVVRATTQKNEPVELHVDNAGTIYKQVWLRAPTPEPTR